MYLGMLSEEGNVVEDEEAFDYALERCLKGTLEEQQEFREMLQMDIFSLLLPMPSSKTSM